MMKNKVWLTVGAFVIFGALAAGSMSSDDTPSSGETAATSATKSDKKTEKAENKDKQVFIGDTTHAGSFAVRIESPEVKGTIGSEYLKQDANGVFWTIPISLRNDAKQAEMIDSSMFTLVSSDGVEYSPDSTASMYMDSKNSFFLQKANPGVQLDGYIVFDMPKDQQVSKYKLRITDGFGFSVSDTAEIQLKKNK